MTEPTKDQQDDLRAAAADKMQYNREQFLAGYSSLVNISQAIRHLNIKEIRRWLEKELAPDMADTEKKVYVERLMLLISAYDDLRETMKKTGVPRMPEAPPV